MSEQAETQHSQQESHGKEGANGTPMREIKEEDAQIHPLQNSWTLWFDNPRKRTSVDTWGSHIKKVMQIGTVEEFWRLYNNIAKPSALDANSNYHLFKDGIEPMWEDRANEHGGQWLLPLPSRSRDKLDELWLYTILAAIGEVLETEGEEEQVCGCVLSVRKSQDRIAIWTKNAAMEGKVRTLGEKWKRLLDLPKNTTISYQAHSDSMKSRTVSLYEV